MTAVCKTMPASGIEASCIRNGIDVAAVEALAAGVQADPAQGRTSWRIRSQWKGGTRSDHLVEGCTLGGTYVPRPFTISVDEPVELGGANQFANPQEYLLAALNACMMVGLAANAALMGIELTKLEVETSGDIDLRGFLGLDANVPAGYDRLRQVVTMAGKGSDQQFAALHERVRATSPNFFNLTRAIPVESRLAIQR